MAGTTPKPNKKTNKPKGENGKPKSLTEELNEQVNAAEKKVQKIEKNKPNPSKVTNDLGEATKQVEEKATPTGTPEEQALAKEAKQNTESPKEEVIDPEEWFRNTKKEPKRSSNEEKESTGNPEGEEPKNKNTPPKGEQGTFDFDFGDKAENKANSKKDTATKTEEFTGIDQNKALNPNDFKAGTGAKDSSMNLYTRFASVDPKNLRDPYGNPIDWNSVDGKSDIAIGLGDRVLTIPKQLAGDMANSIKNNQYDQASFTVARSLGLEAKPDTNAAYVGKGADFSKQGEKYLKKLMEDPNTPGLTRRLLTHLYNNKGKYITGGLLAALAKSLTNDAENDKNNAEAADKDLEDDTPIDMDPAFDGISNDEDTTPGQLAVGLGELANNPDTEVGAANINGHASDGENGESDNPDSIEQASDNLNEAINGIPSHLPQDVPDEEEGKEAAAKEYNPTYTPKQEMYNSLASSTAEPREAEPTFTENTVDQLKAADNVSNGGSVNTPAPTAKAKTRAKSSKAAPVNNAPMAGSRPDVSAPGYGAADLSAALGQAAQGAPVDGYDRMFDPSFLEYMRRVNPNVAYGIEQEMRRRGMM